MRIENRKKGATVMCASWVAIVIISTIYFILTGFDATLVIVLLTDTIMVVIGIPVYMGHIGILAGFNTMSEKELAEYNIPKITSFVGIFFVLTALVSFLATFIAFVISGPHDAFAVFFIVFLVMLLFTAIFPSSKRFKV